MLKFSLPLIALAALTAATPALPAAAGRDAKACQSGKPSVIVRMSGFKKASGRVKIGVYPANTYLKKRGTVAKQTLPLRSTAPMDALCVANAWRRACHATGRRTPPSLVLCLWRVGRP